MRLAVFISGRGSNLKSLLELCPQQDFFLYSNKSNCPGFKWAKKRGVHSEVIELSNLQKWKSFAEKLNELSIEKIYLLGFMKIIPPEFLFLIKAELINIHPSVLPNFPGLGSLEKSIAAQKGAGCSLHTVTEGVDEGPIIYQKKLDLRKGLFSSEDEEERVHLFEQNLVYRHYRLKNIRQKRERDERD